MISVFNTAFVALVAVSSLVAAVPVENNHHHRLPYGPPPHYTPHGTPPVATPTIGTPPALTGGFSLTFTPPGSPFTPLPFPAGGVPTPGYDKRDFSPGDLPKFTPLPFTPLPLPTNFPYPMAGVAHDNEAEIDKRFDAEEHKHHHHHSGFPTYSGPFPTFPPIPTGGVVEGQLVDF